MRPRQSVALGFVILAALLGVGSAALSQTPSDQTLDDLLGAWKEKGGDHLIQIEREHLVIYEEANIRAVRILGTGPGALTVRNLGVRESWFLSRQNGLLRLKRGADVREYEALSEIPWQLDLTPLSLGNPGQLSLERVEGIRKELLRRRDLDQAVRKEPEKRSQMQVVDQENVTYLVGLIREVGWIDAERFGAAASAAAILLAKHSSDPRLMQAILPAVEKDVKRAAISAELFSVLYDGLRLSLGEKQRFGTQLAEDENGPFVVPLEDPEKVDAFRQAIGLQPLSEYLAIASKYLYEGKSIRMPRPDE